MKRRLLDSSYARNVQDQKQYSQLLGFRHKRTHLEENEGESKTNLLVNLSVLKSNRRTSGPGKRV